VATAIASLAFTGRTIVIVSIICAPHLPGCRLVCEDADSFRRYNFIVASMFAGTVLAEPTSNRASKREQKVEERTVFVTGSLIPQRVELLPIGTKTVSPIRFIDRHEIDWTGRQTTPGALINDPSVRIIGH
jgi:hypothetical protein